MREKILALLVEKFPGERKDAMTHLARALALQVQDEEAAKALVDKLTEAQVREYAKEFRADVDKEVSAGTKTFEENLKKKFDLVEKGKTPPPPKDPDKDEKAGIAEIVKAAVAEATKPLEEKISSYGAKELAKARLQELTDKLNTCKDEGFKTQTLKDFSRMTFGSDDEFKEYLDEKAKDIETANQKVSDRVLSRSGGNPLFGDSNKDGVTPGVAAYVELKKENKGSFAGKEV